MSAHFRYLSYVLRHKWFVFVAGRRTGAPLWRLIIHDWTKFLPCEWFPYVENFYGEPRIGEHVEGVADNAGFAGIVREKRPGALPNQPDCYIDPTYGQPRPFWAWGFEVDRPAVRQAFDRAWLHHQHASPHQWQHWRLKEDSGAERVLPMPEHFVREMVADWMGAGRAITGRWEVREWYAKNRDKIVLHPESRTLAESLLAAATTQLRWAA